MDLTFTCVDQVPCGEDWKSGSVDNSVEKGESHNDTRQTQRKACRFKAKQRFKQLATAANVTDRFVNRWFEALSLTLRPSPSLVLRGHK